MSSQNLCKTEYTKNSEPMRLHRGDIWWVRPLHSEKNNAEIKKARPAVILTNEHLLAYKTVSVVTVAFITSTLKSETMKLNVRIESTGKPATVTANQIETVDISRLTTYIGRCNQREMAAIGQAVANAIALPDNIEFSRFRRMETMRYEKIIENLERKLRTK